MKKIKTIFDRDWGGSHKVIDSPLIPQEYFNGAIATEKLDGTNVRVTIRNGISVRLEKRRNPSKIQKKQGIKEPWYVDADEYSMGDKWIYDALRETDTSSLPDGEWSGEAVGKNIQGNPLNLENNIIVFFTLGQAPIFEEVPTSYKELVVWLYKQKNKYGKDCGIEGIVWHKNGIPFAKIKLKDF